MYTALELEFLKPLQYQHPLLPIGADRKGMLKKKKKAPCDRNGYLLSGWNKHEGFTTKELWSHPAAISVGVRCDRLFCMDVDGASKETESKVDGLLDGEPTWEVRRDTNENYWKRIFAPTQEQLDAIPVNSFGKREFSFKISTTEGEAIEFFCTAGRQVIVAGDHYESQGRYYWPENGTPDLLRPPTVSEWSKVLRLAKTYSGETLPRPSVITKNKSDWTILDECPICGRSQRQVCSMSSDKQVISCFHGITYAPPKNLRKGELVNGEWGFSKTQSRSFGDFSIFVKHKPSQVELLQRRLKIAK